MDVIFSEIKKKDVIDLSTGKKLGKIKDVFFTFPEGCVKSFSISGGLFSSADEQLIRLADVVKIGDDAVLVKKGFKKNDCGYGEKSHCGDKPIYPCPPPFPPSHPTQGEGEGFPFRFDEDDYE